MECVAEGSGLVGRWGGEEFVIVCRNKTADESFELGEIIRAKVEAYEFPDICHLTCSIGVTELKAEDDFTSAFNRLDKALYGSKQTPELNFGVCCVNGAGLSSGEPVAVL